jgi:hypothetical protein
MYRSLPQALLIVIYFIFFNRDLSAPSLSLAKVVQHLAAVKNQQINICEKVSQDTKVEMQSLISERAAATTSTKKCASDAGARDEGPSERRRGRGAFEALSALGVYGGQVSSSQKRGAWNAEDEDFDGLGLDKWGYANVVTLTEYARRPRVLFFNYIEAAHATRELRPQARERGCTSSTSTRAFASTTTEIVRPIGCAETAPSSLA